MYFVEISDAGSISAAAQRLRVSQPALSRQLAALEREVGVRLLDRGRKIVLTEAGREFVAEAKSLLRHAERLGTVSRELREGTAPSLSVAAPLTTINEVIAPCLALSSAEQLVTVRVIPESVPAVRILETADLVITSSPPEPGLATVPLGVVPVCAQVPASHAWARTGVRRVDIAELDGADLLVQAPGDRARTVLDGALARRGIVTRTVATCELESIAQSLAAAGHGIGIVSETPRFDLHPVQLWDGDRALDFSMHASWRPDHYAAAAIAALADRFTTQMHAAVGRITRDYHWD